MNDLAVWMYASRSRLPSDANAAIEDIVSRSRVWNAGRDITGMLLFTGVRFAQFVEGPAASIAELKKSISADERHDDLVHFIPSPWTGRRFAGWSLGYSGPSRFVRTAVDQAIESSGQQRASEVENLTRLMIEFAAQ